MSNRIEEYNKILIKLRDKIFIDSILDLKENIKDLKEREEMRKYLIKEYNSFSEKNLNEILEEILDKLLDSIGS